MSKTVGVIACLNDVAKRIHEVAAAVAEIKEILRPRLG